MKNHLKSLLGLTLILTVLSSCNSNNGYNNQTPTIKSTTDNLQDKTLKGVIIDIQTVQISENKAVEDAGKGALIGAGVSLLLGTSVTKTALLGAGVGAVASNGRTISYKLSSITVRSNNINYYIDIKGNHNYKKGDRVLFMPYHDLIIDLINETAP